MMKSALRALLTALAGTLVLVLWGMLFWGWAYELFGVFDTLPDAASVVAALQSAGTQTGTYFVPWPRNTPETFAQFVAQHTRGPFLQLSYSREGVDPQAPGKIARGVLHYFVVSLLAVALLRLATPPSTTFLRKFALVFLAGCIGTVFIRLGEPIWFHLPWRHALGHAVYELVAWALLGGVTAALLRA
jgi:hypothetical protein